MQFVKIKAKTYLLACKKEFSATIDVRGMVDSTPLMQGMLGPRVQERVTSTPFLDDQHAREASPDVPREQESWTTVTESLLFAWSTTWEQKCKAHEEAEAWARKHYRLLQIPTVLIPIALAPVLAAKMVAEDSAVVVVMLILSALTGALQPILGLERKSEQHAQAAFKYSDLITDAEELLAKERRFRAPSNETVSKFKMRMDAAARYSPPVAAAEESDSDEPLLRGTAR